MLQPIDSGHRTGYRLLLASALLALIVIDSASAQASRQVKAADSVLRLR